MDCNWLIKITNKTRFSDLIQPAQQKSPAKQGLRAASRRSGGAAAGTKIFIPQRACTGFCDTFNMRHLSLNDDSQRGG